MQTSSKVETIEFYQLITALPIVGTEILNQLMPASLIVGTIILKELMPASPKV